VDCKKIFADILSEKLGPIIEKREGLLKKKDHIAEILQEGRKKAGAIAQETMKEVRDIVFSSKK